MEDKSEVRLHFARTVVRQLRLTDRETETLHWVAQGKSNSDIATILSIAEKTVKKTLVRVFDKLGVASRTAAALRAAELRRKISHGV